MDSVLVITLRCIFTEEHTEQTTRIFQMQSIVNSEGIIHDCLLLFVRTILDWLEVLSYLERRFPLIKPLKKQGGYFFRNTYVFSLSEFVSIYI